VPIEIWVIRTFGVKVFLLEMRVAPCRNLTSQYFTTNLLECFNSHQNAQRLLNFLGSGFNDGPNDTDYGRHSTFNTSERRGNVLARRLLSPLRHQGKDQDGNVHLPDQRSKREEGVDCW